MSETRHRQCRNEPGYFEAFQKDLGKQKSKGLGDTIAKITQATGIKTVVDKISAVTGKDCGCQQRQEWLNQMFPYRNRES